MPSGRQRLFPHFVVSQMPRTVPGILQVTESFVKCCCIKVCNILLFFLFCGCVGYSLLRAGFLQLRRAGATLHCGAQASRCGGFSCHGAWALGTRASVVVARGLSSCGSWALERRLSSCGAWAQLLRGMWDLPRPGL